MNNLSGISSILALSEQLELLTKLQKISNPFQFSESALSAIQQMSSLSKIPGISSNFSAIADQMSVLSKIDISILTGGISIGTDTVKITPQAKEALDSLQKEFAGNNHCEKEETPAESPASPVETEQAAPDKTSATESDSPVTDNVSSFSQTAPPLEENTAKIYEMSVSDYEKEYHPTINKLIYSVLVPFLIALIFRTDFTPLTDIVSSWYDKYVFIETQKLNAALECNELQRQQLEADQKHNELHERQLEADQEHNELLRQLLETDCKCLLYKESINPKP